MEKISSALEAYFVEWRQWVKSAPRGFDFAALQPMHAGWKVADESALASTITALLGEVELGHIGTVDNRKIVLLATKKPVAGVSVLQVMQLRPGSNDPLGLDHVAFYCADMAVLQAAIEKGTDKWEYQSNPGHTWISLWFGPHKREVKFFDHTSLDLGAQELSEKSTEIKARGSAKS